MSDQDEVLRMLRTVRELVPGLYGLRDPYAGDNAHAAELANRRRVAFLLQDLRYTYKDPDNLRGFAESSIVYEAYAVVCRGGGGVSAQDDTGLGLGVFAFIFALVEHVLGEWSSGFRTFQSMRGEPYCLRCAALLAELQRVFETNPTYIRNKGRVFYRCAWRLSATAPASIA